MYFFTSISIDFTLGMFCRYVLDSETAAPLALSLLEVWFVSHTDHRLKHVRHLTVYFDIVGHAKFSPSNVEDSGF